MFAAMIPIAMQLIQQMQQQQQQQGADGADGAQGAQGGQSDPAAQIFSALMQQGGSSVA
jgi:hypothetical protein